MKRISREDPRFELMRLLDSYARREGVSIRDQAIHVGFLSGFADVIAASKESGTLVHGLRAESMFAYIVAAMGRCSVVKSEDAGDTYTHSEDLRVPDYRLVTSAGLQLLVEVKNHRPASPVTNYLVKTDYMNGLRVYAELFGVDLYFAIYWSHMKLWSLVRSDRFDLVDGSYVLSLGEAMKRSDMSLLGDCMLGTKPPLVFRLLSDPECDRRAEPSGETGFTVGAVELVAGGEVVDDALEKRIAWFLLRYGEWGVSDLPAEVVDGELISMSFEVAPGGRSNPDEDFEFIGFMSQMLSRQYDAMTADDNGVNLLTPDCQPEELGVVIPADFDGKRLHLWRFDVLSSADDSGLVGG